MKLQLGFILILLSFCGILNGQIDNEFWFAAPDVTGGHDCGPDATIPGHGRPVNFYITAEQATSVRIEMFGNPAFVPIEFSLAAGESRKQAITPTYTPDVFENYPMSFPPGVGQTIQKKGFHITSQPGNITVYYELNNDCNRDIFALKGKNALGTDFWVSTQNYFPNGGYTPTPYSGFVIVATEDSTTIHIQRNRTWQYFTGAFPATETIVLNKGETFAFVDNSTAAADHINGVHVTSDKKIAITWYDDSIRKRNTATNYSFDICGDQLIPINLIGRNYLVRKGDIFVGDDGGERFFITATQPLTTITINGTYITTIGEGAVFSYQVNNPIERISCNYPVYINHLTGTGGGGELGGATLPTIDGCTGSHNVTFTRGTNSDPLRLTILVRNETDPSSPYKNKSISNFTVVVGNKTTVIPKAYFKYIPDSTWAYLDWTTAINTFFTNATTGCGIVPGATATIKNPIARFHLGVQNGGKSNGGKYGYFSDYSSNRGRAGIGGPKAPQKSVYCNMDPILFAVEGGLTYKWFSLPPNAGDTVYLSNTTSSEAYFTPPAPGVFKFGVKIYRDCFSDTIIYLQARVVNGPVAEFVIDNPVGCSPYEPTFTNTTDFALADKMLWNFNSANGNYSDTISQPYLTNPFKHLFPQNLSDTLQHYTVRLDAWAAFGECPSYREKIITIKPGTDSQFSTDTNKGCSPLNIDFNNLSSGHILSNGYLWDFGDNTQSFDSIPSKSFINYSINDTTYHVKLIVTSPFGCSDTAREDITVHPYIKASLVSDTAFSCSPLKTSLRVNGSVGVDTFKWNIKYPGYTDIFNTLNYSPVSINYSDTTVISPDTIKVSMLAVNRMGCMDTAQNRSLVTYPQVIADFDISDNDICDSLPIVFTNKSIGHKVFYEWNFGNNTFRQDTALRTHTKYYYNRTNADLIYTISLDALSNYFCQSIKDTTITVHPYIHADFGLTYETNCSPAEAIIYNTSIRSHTNHWTIGYDDFISPDSILNHTFINSSDNKDTIYTVRLITENNEGCSDSLTRSIYLYPRVVADFDLVKNSNCPPLDVEFVNKSTGGYVLNYTWEFGDNTSSTTTDTSFSKTYRNETPNDIFYPIQLTAINLQGCDSTVYDTIHVFSDIDAAFSLDDYENCPPFTITTRQFCSPGTNVRNWYFGDGTFALNSLEPTHTYYNNSLQNDTLMVRLVAMGANDAAHQLCADTMERNVVVYPKLDAEFAFTDDSVGCQPLVTGIQNNSNLIPGTEFRWFIDNEFYQRTPNPSDITLNNLLNTNITKTVYLYGRTNEGCLDTTSHTLTAYSLVDAYFTTDRDTLCSGDSVHIDRQNSQGGISNYRWSFENEAPASNPSPAFYHSFENLFGGVPTDKYVRLIAENPELCRDTMIRRVTIAPQVYAGFNFDNNSVCYPHLTQINNTTQYANSYFWDFGDNINSTQINPEHQYNNFSKTDDKPFIVKLIAKSRYNCYDSIKNPITIKAKPVADFYFPIAAACPPFEVQMDNNSTGNNLSYIWNFANEGTDTIYEPSHTFSNEDITISERTIRLIVNSIVGCSDTMDKSISVYPNVHSDFDMSANAGCSPLNIVFDGTQNETAIQLLWFIDGTAFSTIQNPSHRFVNDMPQNAPHEILYVVRSLYECTDSMTKQITVYPTPIGEFIPSPLPADYDTTIDVTPITFDNQTTHQNNWKYDWDYGNEDFNHEPAAEFTYQYGPFYWGDKNNNYRIPVKMIAYNKNNPECNDTVIHDIIIYPPLPQVNAGEDLKACVPYEVNFESYRKYLDDEDSDSLIWDFGDGTISREPNPTHTYPESGVYTVKLMVKGDGGTNRDYKIISVDPKPEIDFSFNDSLVYVASQTKNDDVIYFYNHTKYASNYQWYFNSAENLGGTPDSEEKEPSWFYPGIGTFYVALIAESEYGCLDTLIHETPIRVLGEDSIWFPTAFYVDPAIQEYDDDNTYPTNKYIFRPRNTGIERYKLEIYNRWGVLVFTSNNVNIGWNGFIQGVPAKQDVYVWRAKGLFTTGQPFDEAGDVTLIYKENK